MKIGDLVKCVWQPRSAGVVNDCAIPMEHTIKDEFGIIVRQHAHYHVILFPQFGYEHDLCASAFEVIRESR